jgi:hypothetical protein
MKQYRVIGVDAKNERLFDIAVEAPNQAVARMMVLAQMCRNFATLPLADRADSLVTMERVSPGLTGLAVEEVPGDVSLEGPEGILPR